MGNLRTAKRTSARRFLGLVTFCLVFASLLTRVQVQTGDETFRSMHPRVDFGEQWESHLIVSNVGLSRPGSAVSITSVVLPTTWPLRRASRRYSTPPQGPPS